MKSPQEKGLDNVPALRKLLKVLEQNLKGLESAAADQNLISLYKGLLDYLRKFNNEDALRILFSSEIRKHRDIPLGNDQLSDEQIAKLSLSDVEGMVYSDKNSKKCLDRIAMVRFNMSKWEVAKTSRDKLIEKIETLISNQKTHEAIGRLAGDMDEH
jgi:hypothetical protein